MKICKLQAKKFYNIGLRPNVIKPLTDVINECT